MITKSYIDIRHIDWQVLESTYIYEMKHINKVIK